MNCYYHPEKAAAAYCRTCGKALCAACQRPALGTIFCAEHVPATASPTPQASAPAAPPPVAAPITTAAGTSPGLAFILGFIPGLGAIYNGQYAKGVVHLIVLGALISILSSGAGGFEPLFGLLLAGFFMYMPFEAYHTARKRQLGQQVDEFSSILPMRVQRSGLPVGPIAMIAVGALFLLDTMDVIHFHQLMHYWPVFLIVLGVYMLYCRVTGNGEVPNGR